MKNNVLICWAVFLDLLDDATRAVSESLGKIAFILQIAVPVLISITDTTTPEKIAISAGWVCMAIYLRRLDVHINRKDVSGFPLPPCVLTRVDKAGFVEMIEGREETAIIYLSELEEYIERKNLSTVDLYRKV